MITGYIVEEMLPLHTVESLSFRRILNKIPVWQKSSSADRKTFLISVTLTWKWSLKGHSRVWNIFPRLPTFGVFRITDIPVAELNTVCTRFGIKCFTDRENLFLFVLSEEMSNVFFSF